ncbi:MAG: hypothetical protein KDD05_03070 [Psychroserpens sp.]|nr:hypothetical protein [Psychroserpens sp.]
MKLERLVFVLLVFVLGLQSWSQEKTDQIELTDLISDIVKTTKDEQDVKQVFWIPKIYWELALKDSPYGNEAVINEINTIVDNYEIFAVSDIQMTAFSGVKKNELKSVKLIIDNEFYKPIDHLPDDLEALLNSLLPVFKKMLGEYGSSIEIIVFDNSNKVTPSMLEQGQFSIEVNGTVFDYRLPLSSLVPKKVCPVDNKTHNGNWVYCPWHGEKLN